jgi:hypothetical protein
MPLTLSQLQSGSALHDVREAYSELHACEHALLAPFHMHSLSLEHGVWSVYRLLHDAWHPVPLSHMQSLSALQVAAST